MSNNKEWYFKGLRDGIPIALGYFAVAFTLGIAAKKAGLGAFQAFLASGLTNASAGGYAAFTLIGSDVYKRQIAAFARVFRVGKHKRVQSARAVLSVNFH